MQDVLLTNHSRDNGPGYVREAAFKDLEQDLNLKACQVSVTVHLP